MTLGPNRARRRHFRTPAICVLLMLAALEVVVESVQPVHVHGNDTAGIYNAACPLAVLAAFRGTALLPSAPPLTWGSLIAGAAVVAPAIDVPASLASHCDPRAPPLF